jgi:tetratricopeptide (TPR) repeat protein
MTISGELSTLEAAGLIALANTGGDIEYIFRHALIQDVVYDSLLKSERMALNRIAAEVMEESAGDNREELAVWLAEHFYRAGENSRALEYYLIAAETASRRYANAEAIENYTKALKAAAGNQAVQAKVLRARGTLYEIIGDFEQALADQQSALDLAQSNEDREGEWDSLINLGMLWASRDYRQTGEYYDRALKIARSTRNPSTIAHSLNRIGNYSTNIEESKQAERYHQEALQIFTRLEDEAGIAETVDLLGMAEALGGDLVQAKQYLERVFEMFERNKNMRGLSSSMTTLSLATSEFQTDILITPDLPADQGATLAERGLRIAEEIGWKSGICYSVICLSFCQISMGEYQKAQSGIHYGLEIAQAIQHRQWEIYARLAAGVLYQDLRDFERAQESLEPALELARDNYSTHWIHVVTGSLASILIQAGDLEKAESLLQDFHDDAVPYIALGQRLAWSARADLALAQGQPELALAITDKLIEHSCNLEPGRAIIRIWTVNARALAAIAELKQGPGEKEHTLMQALQLTREAYGEAERQKYQSRIWQILQEEAMILRSLGRNAEAEQARDAANRVILNLAHQIEDIDLREHFTQAALMKS